MQEQGMTRKTVYHIMDKYKLTTDTKFLYTQDARRIQDGQRKCLVAKTLGRNVGTLRKSTNSKLKPHFISPDNALPFIGNF